MNVFLTLACLFFIGSVTGWVIELLFRNIVHHNKKWVNPGFCTGPYLPSSLCFSTPAVGIRYFLGGTVVESPFLPELPLFWLP